jgi:hypothetical protein
MEYLPSKYEGLNSNPSTAKEKKESLSSVLSVVIRSQDSPVPVQFSSFSRSKK